LRLGRRDDALTFDGVEVGGCHGARQHGARLVAAARAVMQTDTTNQRVLGIEFPHAQPFDVEGACGNLEDAAQPVAELFAGVRVPGS